MIPSTSLKPQTASIPELQPGHPMFGLGYAKPLLKRHFTRVVSGSSQYSDEAAEVAEEVPIALQYNGHPHVVMMATPADLEDFAVGYSISERIVDSADMIESVDVVRHARGIEIHLAVPESVAAAVSKRGRNLVGRTGCGLCGTELIDDVMREAPRVTHSGRFSIDALARAESELTSNQPWNAQTGALHAAAWAKVNGEVTIVREDVGRHNALDKVIGSLARTGTDASDGFLIVTSRASYELVQKAAVASVSLLAAVSRPTGLAVRLAESCGITLVGLLRDGHANIYANPHRIIDSHFSPGSP